MKKIIFLGKSDNIINFLQNQGYKVTNFTEKITLQDFQQIMPLHTISYGYQHIITEDILKEYKIINLHISYLPYNRGANPNFWSFFDNTPKGVTIHFMDKGIDTGNIIFQKKIKFSFNEFTLSTTYHRLKKEIEALFISQWKNIETKNYNQKTQNLLSGSYYCQKDFNKFTNHLPN